MENYTKGKCIEEPLDRNSIPIPNLPDNFLWMQVKGGSKMPRLLDHARGAFQSGESQAVVWTGSGDGVLRTIACAEAMKRECKIEHQITKIGYRKCEDFWEPTLAGLDKLVVNREIPIIHILLSSNPVDASESGYQLLNSKNAFWQTASSAKRKPNNSKKMPKVTAEEIISMGLQSSGSKGKKNTNRYVPKKKSQSELR